MRKLYPSDLTEAQWQLIQPVIPPAKRGGHPRTVDIREVVNAIFYLVRSGCSWRMLPHEFPPWGTVHWYFRTWRLQGIWEEIQEALRAEVRIAEGREASPTAAIIDSQTVKTTEKGGLAATMRARK